MPFEIFLGDCLDLMKLLPASSADAIVTDPPYGIDFMGRGWDNVVPGPDFWRAALRVAKPGAHLLAFGGSRSAHRLACAIEDAGWEIRDSLGWLYATGFPKSLDISKQFDLRGKGSEHLYRFTAWMRTKRLSARRINEITGSLMGGHYLTAKSQPAIPTREFFELLRPHLGEIPAEIEELVERHNRIESIREATGEYPGHSFAEWEGYKGKNREIAPKPRRDTPASRLAKRWAGWGTALKPGLEPIILARKPIDAGSDIASNVKRYGTGAINIDGCRVGTNNLTGQRLSDTMKIWEIGKNLCASCAADAAASPKHGQQEIKGSSAINNAVPIMSGKGKTARHATGKGNTGCCDGPNPAGQKHDLVVVSSLSMSENGGKLSGRSPEDTSSTTLTEMDSTIKSKTCDLCGAEITRDCISGNTLQMRSEKQKKPGEPANGGRQGRFPANVLHDGSEEVAEVFPDTGKSGTAVNRNRGKRAPSRVGFLPGTVAAGPDVGYGDGGSAARFFAALAPTEEDAREALEDFEAEVAEGALGEGLRALYVPKAAKRDREEGCEDLELRQTAKLAGAGREEIDDLVSARFRTFPSRNDHPTVKPTALMRYLCRLVTPPGGVVLDPFAGSGSTGKAALLEGFSFLGIEKTPRYVEIAKRRCAHAEKTAAEAKMAAR